MICNMSAASCLLPPASRIACPIFRRSTSAPIRAIASPSVPERSICSQGLVAAYAAISIPTAPHPGGPFITWAATLRQTYAWPDVQLAFLRTFVSASPETFAVTLSQMP